MAKALFLYSDDTGHRSSSHLLEKVLPRLRKTFPDLDVRKTFTAEEGAKEAIASCGVYDVLIFSGGDGTFNNIISALEGQINAPTIGYINGGTLNDLGRNFGVRGGYRKALRIIERGYTCGFDVGLVNGSYFTYMAAVGAYADISYSTKRKYKRRLGRVVYYFKAMGEAFTRKKVRCHVIADGKEWDLMVPFILCMNGSYVGGFPVNGRKSSMHDGKFELYLTKPGLFNGLLHYLFFKTKTTKIVASDIQILTDYPFPWTLDGEEGPVGDVHIIAKDSKLRIFCAKKYAEFPR